jgi:flagellar motor protein MotB
MISNGGCDPFHYLKGNGALGYKPSPPYMHGLGYDYNLMDGSGLRGGTLKGYDKFKNKIDQTNDIDELNILGQKVYDSLDLLNTYQDTEEDQLNKQEDEIDLLELQQMIQQKQINLLNQEEEEDSESEKEESESEKEESESEEEEKESEEEDSESEEEEKESEEEEEESDNETSIQPINIFDIPLNTYDNNDIVLYENKPFKEMLESIMQDNDVPTIKKYLEFGNTVEKVLLDIIDIFKYVNNDVNKIVSSKSDLVIKDVEKKKLDNYLVDYIGINPIYFENSDKIKNLHETGKVLFELKSLQISYNDCLKNGFIPLTKNKITGLEGEFYPRYEKTNGHVKVKNIYNAKRDYNLGKFLPLTRDPPTLKRNNWDYWAIYFLKDGIYYYDILKDKELKIDYHTDCGQLKNYKIEKIHGRDHYLIPVGKLKQMPKKVFDEIFK